MKTLLAIIITATFSFGCAMLEGEQTTTDTGGGGTTSAPTGGGDSTPTVTAESSVTGWRISAGGEHTCAIKTDGTVKCWGQNAGGQSTVPLDLGTVTNISTGRFHTCAVKIDGLAQCWGFGTFGQTAVPSDLGMVSSISAGGNHTCAIKTDSTVKCWGADVSSWVGVTFGQSTVPADLGTVTSISSGDEHTCAVKTGGTVKCWGRNNFGQSVIPSDLGIVSSIDAGHDHTCAIKTDGTVKCWGGYSVAQSFTPPHLGTISSISVGKSFTSAVKTDGTVRNWGQTNAGRDVPLDLGTVSSISSGDEHTCAIKTDGNVQCWGDDSQGQSTVPADLANSGSGNVNSSAETIWSGTQQLGASGIDSGQDITTDSDGNIYVTGTTSGNLDNNTSSGGKDIFVTKYDSSGSKKWTQQLGSSSDDEGLGVTTDNSGNVYVTGITNGSLENNTTAGVADFFIVKYSSQGDKQWIRQLGSPSHDSGNAIATDSNGNIFVTGVTYGAFDGNTNAGPFTGSYDLFIVKYDSNGTKKWTRQLGTYGSDYGNDIEVDSAGNAYVTGHTNGGLDGNTNAGNYDMFIVKYDNDGTKKWTRQLGASLDDHGQGIGVDNSGNVYVTGKTLWQLPDQVAAGGYDVFITKYSDNGTKQWTRQFGTSEIDDGTDLALDVDGNVYVTGYTRGNLDGVSNNGADDFFVTKYSDNGTKQWSKLLGTTAGEQGNGISVDAAGNSFVTGFTSAGFDGNSSFGSDDVFVTKLDTNGNKK